MQFSSPKGFGRTLHQIVYRFHRHFRRNLSGRDKSLNKLLSGCNRSPPLGLERVVFAWGGEDVDISVNGRGGREGVVQKDPSRSCCDDVLMRTEKCCHCDSAKVWKSQDVIKVTLNSPYKFTFTNLFYNAPYFSLFLKS